MEYVKNTVVKYLESNDASVLPALFSALHLSQHDIARVQAAIARRAVVVQLTSEDK